MRTHELKCWPGAFEAMADGTKRFEYRKDDRGYEVGDLLKLRYWDPSGSGYFNEDEQTPEPILVKVTYILRGQFSVPDDYVVMSVVPEPKETP